MSPTRNRETTKLSVVQEKGQVTIPAELRRRWGLRKGVLVAFEETEEGILIRPQKVVALDVLDRLRQSLAERGIDLEDLLTSGREIREEVVRELYRIFWPTKQHRNLNNSPPGPGPGARC